MVVVKLQKKAITAKKVQRMEEAGHPLIKIRFKRLANLTTKSQTESQPETNDRQTCCSASSQSATHETNELVGDCPHPIPGDHAVSGQMVEAMLVDQPLQPGSGTLPHYGSHKETRTKPRTPLQWALQPTEGRLAHLTPPLTAPLVVTLMKRVQVHMNP